MNHRYARFENGPADGAAFSIENRDRPLDAATMRRTARLPIERIWPEHDCRYCSLLGPAYELDDGKVLEVYRIGWFPMPRIRALKRAELEREHDRASVFPFCGSVFSMREDTRRKVAEGFDLLRRDGELGSNFIVGDTAGRCFGFGEAMFLRFAQTMKVFENALQKQRRDHERKIESLPAPDAVAALRFEFTHGAGVQWPATPPIPGPTGRTADTGPPASDVAADAHRP